MSLKEDVLAGLGLMNAMRARLLDFWANQTPLFGGLVLRNPNSLDLADSLAGFSQSLEIQ